MPPQDAGMTGEVFTRVGLDDGVTLHLLKTDKFKTVTIRAVIRRNLTPDEVARNACIPFVLRRGARRYPDTRTIERFLEDLYGARFGVDSVKIGETQVLEFDLEVAADRYIRPPAQLVREGLFFLGEILLRPVEEAGGFRPSFVAQEADVLKRRIEGLINDKPRYALERLRQTMCANEPFGLHRYGTLAGLDAVDPVELYAHYERVLRESPIDLFVVGDMSPEQVEEWVRQALPFPRGSVASMRRPQLRMPRSVREVKEEEEVHQGIVAIGYRSPVRYPDGEYERLLMYNGILGAFPHSKLFTNVRERASLAYFAGSRLDGTTGILVAFAGIDPGKYEMAREIMERQVEDMAAGRITDEEMEATRRGLIHGLRTAADSAESLIGHQLLAVVNGGGRTPTATIEGLEAVSRADVQQLAGRVVADTVYFLTRPAEAEPRVAETTVGKEEGE